MSSGVIAVLRRVCSFVAVGLFLTGCEAGVEAFSVTVGERETGRAVELRDPQRLAPELEALVSAGTDGERRFEMHSLPTPAAEAADAVLRAVLVELSGGISGGLSLEPGPDFQWEPVSLSFASTVRATVALEGPSVTLRLPLAPDTTLSLADLEAGTLSFSASAGNYRIHSVNLETTTPPPSVRLPGHPEGPLFDSRLPVSISNGETVVESDRPLRLSYRAPDALFAARGNRPAMSLAARGPGGAEAFRVQLRPGEHDLIFRAGAWLDGAGSVAVADLPEGVELLSVQPVEEPADPSVPRPVELTELLNAGTTGWRESEWELYSWSLYPDVLWLDSLSYEVQARFFRRLAFFVEKRGFIATLLSDAELAGRHGWNAHNYRPEGLAAFFNAVDAQNFPINRYEERLRELLLANGTILRDAEGRYQPGTGGILAISQESFYELRRLLIVHEALHGVFYEEAGFVDDAFAHWRTGLDQREREFWRTFFSWMTYSPDDEYLMVNEMQAYLLQQQEAAVRWYFRTRIAGRLRNGLPARVPWLDGFLADYPETFRRAADVMNASLFRHAGMLGGDPFCLVPLPSED